MPTMNGMRQRQPCICDSLRKLVRNTACSVATRTPIVIATYMLLHHSPRRLGGALSAKNVCEALTSPPSPNPCVRRATSSSKDAATPIEPYVGATAISRLPSAVTPIATTMAVCRPRRSASQPKNKPPTGRMKKPTANTASVPSSAATGSWG